MDQRSDKQFLVVAPDGVDNMVSFRALQPYIYKFIRSSPCPELLRQVREALQETDIYGILTRGSLAQYLYVNRIPVPIFELNYELYAILNLLKECVADGYRKICIFEIGSYTPGQDQQEQRTQLFLGDYELSFYRFYDRASVEQEIRQLWGQGKLDLVIGDVEPIMIAKRLGLPSRNFVIDERSYRNTIEEARYVTNMTLKARAQDRFISVITNIIAEAVIIADETGKIQSCNLQAERLLLKREPCTQVQELFGMELPALLELPVNQLTDIRGKRYVVSVIPRVVGEERMYAFVLSNANDVEKMELSIRRQNRERGLTAKTFFQDIVCRDPVSIQLVEMAKRYAKSNGTILLRGETGTGKEVIASSIHNESLRADGPFLAINCATFNENLIESELFGYEKGAFTGALPGGKQGLFELAHHGSLFLDEVGELPLSLQAKLLRVLQEKEVMRVGGSRIIPVDVRIIAATNRDLLEMVQQKKFREDLYYRLALLELDIPPLRRRREDIVPLFTSFLAEVSEQEKRAVFWDDMSVFEPILDYDWPGNIRELRNFAERVVLLCRDYRLDRAFLARMMQQKGHSDLHAQYTAPLTDDLKALERHYIAFLLERFGGDKDKLCSYLHISRSTLWRKLDQPYRS